MKPVRVYDTPAYRAARKRMLARRPTCWWHGCTNPATEADHDPPVSFHRHVEHDYRSGSGCCRLRPACSFHQRRQGGLIRAGKAGQGFGDDPDDVELGEPEQGYPAGDPVWLVPWLDDLREVPANATWPRFMSAPHPRAVGSLGVEFEWWCRTHRGAELRWWQRLVARRLLEVDADGRLVWGTLILTLARQLGKSLLLWLILAWRLHQGDRFGTRQLLLHQSIAKGQAASVLQREVPFTERRPDLYDVEVGKSKQGDVSIEWRADGSAWLVISTGTARSGGAYGWSSVSAAAVDEAWSIPPSVVDDGTEPTLLESVDPWLALVSTAHRNATSLMIARRHLAIEDLASVEAYALLIDWSARPGLAMDDPQAWREASPHWTPGREQRISAAVQRAMLGIASDEDNGMSPVDAVNAQYLNRWPSGRMAASQVEVLLPAGAWEAAFVDVEIDGPAVIAVEDWMGSGAGAAYAGRDGDGRIVLGGYTHASRSDAYRWARSLVTQRPGSILLVGATLRDDADLQDFPATTDTRTTADTRSALSLLRELLTDGRAVQDGQGGEADLRAQMTAARVKPAAGGGLALVNDGRLDLVKAAAWAVAEVSRRTVAAPAVHGGPLTSA